MHVWRVYIRYIRFNSHEYKNVIYRPAGKKLGKMQLTLHLKKKNSYTLPYQSGIVHKVCSTKKAFIYRTHPSYNVTLLSRLRLRPIQVSLFVTQRSSFSFRCFYHRHRLWTNLHGDFNLLAQTTSRFCRAVLAPVSNDFQTFLVCTT